MGAIKRGLAQSIEALEKAVSLDPNDGRIRENLRDHKDRVAALPRS